MRNQRTIFLLGMVLLALALLACDAGNLVAFANPTATRTRTPRPTFTPRPSITPTPADTETPAATDTPAKSPTATKAPVATSRPVTRAPTAPPASPVPSFPVVLRNNYFCEQSQTSFWEIIGRINRSSPPAIFLGGYMLAVYAPDGRLLGTSRAAAPDGDQVSDFDFNCMVSGWYQYNVKIDVTEFRMQLPLTIRVIRSKTDLTPLSPAFKADFPQPGRYFLEYNAPQ